MKLNFKKYWNRKNVGINFFLNVGMVNLLFFKLKAKKVP
jgi:hypothetical protein